jgi:UDP-N-acetylglucosamine 2-epimerase (non-hydrolysing)
VDVPDRLRAIATALTEVARERRVIFPVHPRTRQRLDDLGLGMAGVELMEPLAYPEMLDLVSGARVVVTDSGGLQEETTALGVPCLTLRPNTERPITITEGTNRLVQEPGELPALVRGSARTNGARRPEGWDGRAGERVVEALAEATP